MFDYLPPYNRGESLLGYTQRCSTGARMVRDIPTRSVRVQICREFAEHSRNLLRQPF